ncbi:MAG TPA: DNA topoisomerase III [Bacilli bacterium]
MKALVLAEKPSVARELARVLGCTQKTKSYIEGPKYVVTWALSHLVTLAEPEDYDAKFKTWNLEDLPILPPRMELKVIKETSPQFKAIAQLAKRNDLNEIIIATDAGREGELVARWIMELIKWRKPFRRLWISSQTDKAIKEGFANLKAGSQYNSLYQSAVCRAEADWFIGLNVTRALTSKYNAQLAAGRVQTPTLAMLINREKEIKNFKPVEYRLVEADFGSFRGTWRSPGTQESRIFDLPKAEVIREKVQGQTGKVTQLKTTQKTEAPPLPYDLTELQRDANKRYGFSAKQTSTVLQKLYEQHKMVTYPRTDSRYLSADIVPTFKGRLSSAAVGPYAALINPLMRKPLTLSVRAVDDSKVTDHHAIIPTEQYVNLNALTAEERRLYDLIVRRFIALFYPVYRYDETTLVVEVAKEPFHAAGKVIKESGWKEVYGKEQSGQQDPDEGSPETENLESHQLLPDLIVGHMAGVKKCEARNLFTKPPAHYTEATLLTFMEKFKLGTPATRADIIEKLLSTDTIERQGVRNHLIPTGKGLQLIELVAAELRSPELTAKWEQELENISKGKGNMEKFLLSIRQQTTEMVREVKNSATEYKPHNLTHSKCPECDNVLSEVKNKKGKMLVCINRECTYRRSAEKQLSNKRCPQCRKKMEINTGKAGKYAQCRSCNVIEMLDDNSGGRIVKKEAQQLIRQYSDNKELGSNLGDLLKAAMEKQK